MPSSTTPSSPRRVRVQKELLVAWTLLLLDGDKTYGYLLHQQLLERGVDLQASSMYRRLAKFERAGWVESSWSTSVDGPRRHVYVLTDAGRVALRGMTALIRELREAYGAFLDDHALAVARRGADGEVDEDATPAAPATPATGPPPGGAAQEAAGASPLGLVRPRQELLVGRVLLALDAGATYGYDLRREFNARRMSADPAALYRVLRRLEADKWVQSRWMRPSAGPPRRFYRLTSRGRRNLDEIARLVVLIRDAHDAYLHAAAHVDAAGPADRPADPIRPSTDPPPPGS
ncbi:MAG: PadR family transcriptional regulator [Solirubrobacteraceae bacterium]|nr:PadR family transcriptional regulator [Solirubrobacteraceae bacterium]